jgi:hypothetical protein
VNLTKQKLAGINIASLGGVTALQAMLPVRYHPAIPFLVQLGNWVLQSWALGSPRPNLASRNALGTLWQVSFEQQIDLQALALARYGKQVGELSSAEASALIRDIKARRIVPRSGGRDSDQASL